MTLQLHGTAVAYADQAIVIFGPSGSGKSSLALDLIAHGATLVADDQVIVKIAENGLAASCPNNISGLIEARYVGVLNVEMAPATSIAWAVDLGKTEVERIPEHRVVRWLGHEIPLLWGTKSPHFAVSLLQLLKAGRSTR